MDFNKTKANAAIAAMLLTFAMPAGAATNWRLMCSVLSGDLTEPGELAAFRRCLTLHDPRGELIRQKHPAPRRRGIQSAIQSERADESGQRFLSRFERA
jgi:hypothetical protein